jgi:HTH-type transcriptional regulator, transcriptional repressor of NAD biosynthesis genes
LAPLRTRVCLTVCLIGPECTGKTTLAERLSVRFNAPWVPEFAREYALRGSRLLTFDDVELIARGQMALEDALNAGVGSRESGVGAGRVISDPRSPTPDPRLVILDTDLISTLVYSRHYYGQCPAWIEAEARLRKADLYLLTDIDVPWTADDVRDTAAARAALHEQFATTLADYGANFITIRGDWEQRFAAAVAAIESYAAR